MIDFCKNKNTRSEITQILLLVRNGKNQILKSNWTKINSLTMEKTITNPYSQAIIFYIYGAMSIFDPLDSVLAENAH